MAGRADETSPSRVTWKDWIPAISLALVLLGTVWTFGGYVSQLQEQSRDIEALKADVKQRADLLNQIDVRTARIEAKLEILTGKPERDVRP